MALTPFGRACHNAALSRARQLARLAGLTASLRHATGPGSRRSGFRVQCLSTLDGLRIDRKKLLPSDRHDVVAVKGEPREIENEVIVEDVISLQ